MESILATVDEYIVGQKSVKRFICIIADLEGIDVILCFDILLSYLDFVGNRVIHVAFRESGYKRIGAYEKFSILTDAHMRIAFKYDDIPEESLLFQAPRLFAMSFVKMPAEATLNAVSLRRCINP